MALNNTFDGGTDGVAVTTGNSGGASGDAFNAMFGTALIYSAAAATDGSPMGATVAGGALGAGQWTISGTSAAAQIKIQALAASTGDTHLIYFSDGTGRIFSVHIQGTGKLRVDDATGTTGVFTFANAWTVGQYYLVKVFATAGTTTSNGVIKVAYYAGNSQTPAETVYVNSAANLGAGRSFTKAIGGKITASAEAYNIEGPFTVDTAATDLIPFPTITIAVPASATAIGAPAPTISTGATVFARMAAASAIAIPTVVSAESDVVGDGFPTGYSWVNTPTVTAGGGVTVLGPTAFGAAAALPPASVTAASDAIITTTMTTGAVGAQVAPTVTLMSTGPATLSGAGTLTVTGTVAEATIATLSGTGVLAVTGAPGAPGVATLSGSGALSVTGSPSVPAAATFTGSGTLVSTGVPAITAGATAAGSGVLAIGGTPSVAMGLALSGAGALTVTAGANYGATATLSGLGALTIAPVRPSITDTVTLTGGGVLTITASPQFTGAINPTGVGALTVAQLIRDLTLAGSPWPNRWASRPKQEVS